MDIKTCTDEEVIALEKIDMAEELKMRGYVMGWHKPVSYAGAIYILVNPAFPKLVKIGYADDVEKRIKILNSNSGLPDPYHCYATYKVKKRLEDLQLHKLIDTLDSDLRHTSNREFYEMSTEKAYGILSAIAQINGDESLLEMNPLSDPYFSEIACTASTEMKEKPKNETGEKQRNGRLIFEELDIPVGAELSFREDLSIKVYVANKQSGVRYNGKTYKISAAVKQIKRDLGTATKSEAYQGGSFFLYEEETLVQRRIRMQKEQPDLSC